MCVDPIVLFALGSLELRVVKLYLEVIFILLLPEEIAVRSNSFRQRLQDFNLVSSCVPLRFEFWSKQLTFDHESIKTSGDGHV